MDDPMFELFMVEIRAADWSASLRWYSEILGIKPIMADSANRFALLAAGSGRLALKEGPGSGERGAVRLVFRVGDVDSERSRLIGLGVAVGPVIESAEGYREARLADPDGTPVHLFSWVRPVDPFVKLVDL